MPLPGFGCQGSWTKHKLMIYEKRSAQIYLHIILVTLGTGGILVPVPIHLKSVKPGTGTKSTGGTWIYKCASCKEFKWFRFWLFDSVQMDELQDWTQRSLRRWYAAGERSGELDPYWDYVMSSFVSPKNQIIVEFPFPKDVNVNTTEEITTRQISYYDTWEVKSGNYLINIYDSIGLHNLGQLRDWRNNRLRLGYVRCHCQIILILCRFHLCCTIHYTHYISGYTSKVRSRVFCESA